MLAQSPFDILAETYDEDFTQSRIGKLQRERVWKFLDTVLQSCYNPLKILEINCGTGEDALRLAAMGHSVIATDASEIMIEKARQKSAISKNNSDQIEFIQCSFNELNKKFRNKNFDLVFSNFGGINCINKTEIAKLSTDLSSLISPAGHLFLTVMSRFCLWEIIYYGLKGKMATAFRRQKKSVLFNVNRSSMWVFYYSPYNLKKIFRPKFKLIKTYPVGLFIPPSYLEKQFLNRRNWLNRLNRWEEKFGNNSTFSSLADHYCMILKRNKE